ncbi:MAG TPA: hypothetical protein VIL03_01020 [Clostridia bacterium]|jgi:hypothetical protein
MDTNSNNMLSNLLPLLMNRGLGGAGNNNMLAMLLPLLQRGGQNGNSNELLKTLLPMMAGNNPQLAQVLSALNNNPVEQELQNEEPIEVNPQNIKYSPNRRNIDFSKLYPDLDKIDIHTMPKIEDYNKEQAKSAPNENKETNNSFQNSSNPNNTLMTLLTLMQNLRRQQGNSFEEKVTAVDGIAPPKIKKSLKAILALNSIIND